jgi:hypothetical protein
MGVIMKPQTDNTRDRFDCEGDEIARNFFTADELRMSPEEYGIDTATETKPSAPGSAGLGRSSPTRRSWSAAASAFCPWKSVLR